MKNPKSYVKSKGFKPSNKGRQGKKDNKTPRVNFDNTRESKFIKDVDKEIEQGSKMQGANNIEDFNRNAELLRSAGSFPFSSILGKINIGNANQVPKNSVPGIMAYVYEATYGITRDGSIANKAMQQVYSYIVHANSRSSSYEYTDLAMYCIAGMEVFAAIADAIRVYGTIMHYSEKNEYLADDLVLAMGFNPSDIRNNRGQMWFDINNLIMQTKQIWIPDVFPILHRYIRLNSYVYTDAAGQRSQIYVPVRNKYFMLSETASDQGTCLLPALYTSTNSTGSTPTQFRRQLSGISTTFVVTRQRVTTTWEDFKNMIQTMINSLVASQDRGTIYGDILKAYGAEKIYAMPQIGADYEVVPEFNPEILMQIENLTTAGFYWPAGILQRQDVNVNRLYAAWDNMTSEAPTVKQQEIVDLMPTNQVLNMHMESQPTPESVMIATRLKASGCTNLQSVDGCIVDKRMALTSDNQSYWSQVTTGTKAVILPKTVGSELVTGVWIYKRGLNQDGLVTVNPNFLNTKYLEGTLTAQTVKRMFNYMAFDWHPFIYDIEFNESTNITTAPNWYDSFGDFDNYTTIDDVKLSELNDVAIYSLFGVPQI